MLDVEEFVLLFQEFFFLMGALVSIVLFPCGCGTVEFAFHVFVFILHDVNNFWR